MVILVQERERRGGRGKGLRDTGQPIVVQEVIAKRIIKAAMKGERDPARPRKAD